MNVEAVQGLVEAAGSVVKKWKEAEAARVLIGIAREKRAIETVMGEDQKPHKEALGEIKDEYSPFLLALEEASEALREAALRKCSIVPIEQDVDPIELDDGQVVFTKRWGYTVVELGKVPREYLTVNSAKVTEEMRKGVRKIAGIRIEQKRGVEVRPKW